jgi:hypothetical protein
MDMKDRIDNFLKVAEERMNNDVHDRDLQRQLVDLCGELTELTKDPDEQNRLHDGFVKAQANARIAAWDERFLDVIAGEPAGAIKDTMYDNILRQASRGHRMGKTLTAPNQYLGSAASGTALTSQATLTMGKTSISELELAAIKKLANENKI